MTKTAPSPVSANAGTRVLAWGLLWLLVCVLPVQFLQRIFLYNVERDRSMQQVSVKKLLRAEMSSFQREIKSDQFLQEYMGLVGLSERKPSTPYQHAFLRGESFPTTRTAFEALLRRVTREVGARPLCAMAYHGRDRRWMISFHRSMPVRTVPPEFGRALDILYKMNSGIGVERHTEWDQIQKRIFSSALGSISPPPPNDGLLSTKFNRLCYDRVFQVLCKCFGETGQTLDGLMFFAFRESDLSPRRILQSAVARPELPGYKRSFGAVSSGRRSFFKSAANGLCFYAPVSGRFQHLMSNAVRFGSMGVKENKSSWLLRVRAPASQLEPPSAAWIPAVRAVCHGFVCATGILLLLGLRSPQFFTRHLRTHIAITFLIGASLPAAGLGWLASSYFAAERRLSAEETLDFMGTELERADHRLNRQIQRAMLHVESLRRTLQKHFSSSVNLGRSAAESRGFLELLVEPSEMKSIIITTDHGVEHFYTGSSDKDLAQRISFLFKGVFLEALFGRGSFAAAGLSRAELERHQTTMSVLLSILERNLEPEFFNSFFMNPGLPVENSLSTIFERFTLFFLGTTGKPPRAIGMFHNTSPTMNKGFFRFLRRHPEFLVRERQGFTVSTHFFPIYAFESADLQGNWPGTEPPPLQDMYRRLLPLADAIARNRVNVRLNDLDGAVPRLVAARFFGNGEVLAVSEAVPANGTENQAAMLGLSVALAGYGLLLAGVLGGLTAFSLTRPFPALLQAMRLTAEGRFDWTIDLERQDELGELGASFNRMAVGLRERELMRRYVSDDVLEAVSSDDETRLKPGGERVEVTVLFSDIRGFTTLSETHPAEEIVTMLNRYFSVMEQEIRNEGGILDKFIGDAVQAIFREKDGSDPAVLRATRAAFAMRRALKAFNEERRLAGAFPVQSGIGLASGAVVSGRIGSSQGRIDFTVVGPPVLRAAKLEMASKEARHTGIILDGETIERLGNRAQVVGLPRSIGASDEDSLSGIGELIAL